MPASLRSHNKYPLKCKHLVIKRIFLRLQDASPLENFKLLALRAATISNELYRNNVMSSIEMANVSQNPFVVAVFKKFVMT